MKTVETTKEGRAGKKVKVNGVFLEFNENLVAEVSDENYDKVLGSDKCIYPEGELPEIDSKEESIDTPKKEGIPSPGQAKKMLEQRKKDKEAAKASEEASQDDEVKDEDLPQEDDKSSNEPAEEDLGLGELSFKELKEICESENFPGDEWDKMKSKKDLVGYIKSKLSD